MKEEYRHMIQNNIDKSIKYRLCMSLVMILIVCSVHSHDIYASAPDTPPEFQMPAVHDAAPDISPESQRAVGYAASDSSEGGFSTDVNVYTSYNYLPVGSYDSADTAILQGINFEERKVTLYNTGAAKSYTLNYDGTTYVSDKYGTAMSIEQLTEGMIVNVNFYKSTKQLVDIQISPEAWTYDSVTKYDLGGINSTATIGDRTYALTKGVQVFSEGKQTDLLNIVDGDSITVSGIGYDIYSIKVESGHGYVRLTGDEALIGGWIEIGGVLITQVTEPGMLLTVPEGTYSVQMYNDNSSANRAILVERNQEILLDCSDITAPVDTFGRILFHVTPSSASLKMDGALQDISGIVKAEYGIHEIEVSAPGYDTLHRYINVGNELAEITINLEESVAYASGNSQTASTLDESKKAASANALSNKVKTAASGNSTAASANKSKTVSASKANRVYVYAPEGAEVYVDGIYSGLIPMSFKKVAGAHTIILKKTGYETRSYTIYVYDDGEDMSISFSELASLTDDTTDNSTDSSADKGNDSETDSSTDKDKTTDTDTTTDTSTDKDATTDTTTDTESGTDTSSEKDSTSGSTTDTSTGTDTGSNTDTSGTDSGSASGAGTASDGGETTGTDTGGSTGGSATTESGETGAGTDTSGGNGGTTGTNTGGSTGGSATTGVNGDGSL